MQTIRRCLSFLLKTDSMLSEYVSDISPELQRFQAVRTGLLHNHLSLTQLANAYRYFGLHQSKSGWTFREWLPGADSVSLIGDFNDWNISSTPLYQIGNGVWETFIPGRNTIKHLSYYKLSVLKDGQRFERLPAYTTCTDMDWKTTKLCSRVWSPARKFKWTDKSFINSDEAPLIYEAHIGMAQEFEGIGSFRDFANFNLPRIKTLGYNTIQLMAIQEHPYYASFGYQVTNFFAPSFRFGTPDDLRDLINKAHGMGIRVLLDIVHSHSSSNTGESLFKQDGTDDMYFLSGSRGIHPEWKTLLFDYSKSEVLEFLLSNLKYWMKEFHFDGFRFDGVTSMIYQNHGIGESFLSYNQYYSQNTNYDAMNYLRLANELIHTVRKNAISICEEMSGMPGTCLSYSYGGLGFDYRLSMGIPDYWIKLIKNSTFDNWNLSRLWYELTTSRPGEKSISYSESHDQALVGDQTLLFRMLEADMYNGMERSYHSYRVDNAICYIKLIKFLTIFTAKNGYLNFMGNEFGHPEWIDFPREGNNWSYRYARRQWSLAYDSNLKYSWLECFDKAIIFFTKNSNIFEDPQLSCTQLDKLHRVIVFIRNNYIFLINLSPESSVETYFVPLLTNTYKEVTPVLSSDEPRFGGMGNVQMDYIYYPSIQNNRFGFNIYLPCKTAIILKGQ